MNTTPPRRIRFGLRSLFVLVTVAAIGAAWVGYSLNWIRDRRVYVDMGETRHERESLAGVFMPISDDEKHLAPCALWLFGEVDYQTVIYFPPANEPEVDHVRRLFPEAGMLEYEIPSKDRPARPQQD